MKSFFRYFKNFFKYKIFRVITYLILTFLILMFFKIKGAKALYIEGATTNVYFETQNCQLNDNTFNCNKGTSYKFVYEENTTNNDTTFFPFILNNQENYVFFKNMIMNFSLSTPITIDSTNRSIGYNFSVGNYISAETNTYGSLYFVPNFMDSYGINSNDTRDNRLMSYSTYAFKPYYASYIDSDDVEHTCGIIYEHASATTGWFTMVFDIPLNTQVKGLKLYLGNYKFDSTYNAVTLVPNIKVPSGNFAYYDSNIADRTNLYYYGRLYNTYRTTDNDDNNKGLLFLQKGVAYYQPKFNINNNAHSLQTFSNSYSSNTYKYYFTNLSNEDLSSIQNSIPRIEEELNNQQSEGDFDNLFNGFINSSQASSFTNLFNALFSYPIAKFNESLDEGLFDDTPANNKGTGGLNLALCTGRGIIGDVSEDRIKIPFYGGVKWTIPCLHYDIYSQMHDENTSIYPASINGINIQSGRGSTTFYTVYRLILRGVLVYLLFINVLDIYKYILDSDRKEIEVIDL